MPCRRNRFVLFIFTLSLCVLAGGCATMSAEDCTGADWLTLGLADGASGQTPAKADRGVPDSLRRPFEYRKMLLPCCMCHTRVSTRGAQHAVSSISSAGRWRTCQGRFKMQTLTDWGAKITSTRTAVGQFKGQFNGAMDDSSRTVEGERTLSA